MKKIDIVLLATTSIALLCFTTATISFLLNWATGVTIWEGWLLSLYCLYCKDRYQIYKNREERRRCGCYETSK